MVTGILSQVKINNDYRNITEWLGSQHNIKTGLELADAGIPVFPCNEDKTPATAHGHKDADTNPDRIKLFFRKPNLLIGLPTGLASNIDVLDEDIQNDGNLSTLGEIPMTVVARTRSGGRHVFFRHRDGIRNTTGLRQGIDVRGEGGYVVLWAHSKDGEWLSGNLFADLPYYPDHLRKGGVKLRAGGLDTEAIRNGVRAESRNDSIFKGLRQYRHFNKPIEEAKEWAADAARNSSPPYTEVDTDEMAERVYAEYDPGDFPEVDEKNRTLAGQSFHHTDMGNADRFEHLYGDRFFYVPDWRAFVVWTGKRWEIDRRGEMGRLAERTVRAIYREAADTDDADERKIIGKWAKSSEAHHRLQAMLERLKTRRTASPDDFDRDPMLFNCSNGTLNLRTGQLREHDSADMITKLSPVAYDPSAKAPTWTKTVSRALPGYALRKFVQRALGHSLTGDNSEHALFIAHGGGSNSKSTILEAAMDCMGDYATVSAEDVLIDKAGGHPTDVADLAGSRLVVASEVKEGAKLDEPKIKRMTGDRTLKARRMKEDFREFPKTFKIFMPVNHKPTIQGTDHGIWRRIKLIPFGVTIPKAEQDPRLPEKRRDELPGILAWLVRGCLRWQREGLGEPAEVTAATSDYKDEMDTLAAFLSDRCVIEAGAEEGATDLFNAYKEWCADANETAGTQKVFGGKLGERGFEKKRKEHGTVYFGIRLARPRLNHPEPMNLPEPKSGIGSPASASRGTNQKKVQDGSEGSAEEVMAVAESIRELYEEDDEYRFADDRELWQSLVFRLMVPEDLDLETVRHARRMLP
jgi:P4 family phage/plasmid primase-like protien